MRRKGGYKMTVEELQEELASEKDYMVGCDAIIEKFLERMCDICNLCVGHIESGPYDDEKTAALSTLNKIYNLSLISGRHA